MDSPNITNDALRKRDSQSRKYLLTINNPQDKQITHDSIKATIEEHFSSIQYYCISDEVGGKDKTHHTHIFLMFSSPVRFSQIKKHFPAAHIDRCKGSAKDNRDYVYKEGKHADTDKASTNLRETHFESGDLPEETGKGFRTDLAAIHGMIREGATTEEIVEEHPQQILNVSRIEQARQMYLHSDSRSKIRDIFVTYVHGKSETGKTRGTVAMHDLSDTYRVTNYKHPFDHYNGESVLILDEYRSSIEISQMLNIIDIYPNSLEARYSNRQAAYTRVYIISNEPLSSQYPVIQVEKNATWKAFRRRIHLVVDFDKIATQTDDFDERTKLFSAIVDQAYEAHLKRHDPTPPEPQQMEIDALIAQLLTPEIYPDYVYPTEAPDYVEIEELDGLTPEDYETLNALYQ